MSLRTILEFPDPRLRERALPVRRFDGELGGLIDDMFETMYAAPGIGLAAPQIDVQLRGVRARLRGNAGRVRAARDGSHRGQAVRRLPLRPQARAHSQEAAEGTQVARRA